MNTPWKLFALFCGGAAVGSLLVYAFTGLPLWAPVSADGEGFLRTMLLLAFHSAAIGAAAYVLTL